MNLSVYFDTQQTSARIEVSDCYIESNKIFLSGRDLSSKEFEHRIDDLHKQLDDCKRAGIDAFKKYGHGQALPTKSIEKRAINLP